MDEETCEKLCTYWKDLEMCVKYEKKFNFYIEKAIELSKNEEKPQIEESNSLVPDLKCFSLDFQLTNKPPKSQKSLYQELQSTIMKKQVYHVLFNQNSMIENPFILDFILNQSQENQKMNHLKGKKIKKILNKSIFISL
jgi:hypothetical protein